MVLFVLLSTSKTKYQKLNRHKRPGRAQQCLSSASLQLWRPSTRFRPIVVRHRVTRTPAPFQSHISFYRNLFTIWPWLKTLIRSDLKRPHISRWKDMPSAADDWLWRREPYSMPSWRAFWTMYRGLLNYFPQPCFKASLVLFLHPTNYSSLECRY